MENQKVSRFPWWIVAVLVLAAIVFLWRRNGGGNQYPLPTPPPAPTPTPTCVPLPATTPGVQKVTVGSNACVTPECITVQANRDSVQWKGPDGAVISIEFRDEVFSGMNHNTSGTYSVPCSGALCNSGQPKPQVPPPPPGTQLRYTYSQTLQPYSGPVQKCGNGRIIIQW